MKTEERVREILKKLRKAYPKPKTALRHSNPFELLSATILSAQSTDEQVNRVTETLFKKYREVKDFAQAPIDELERSMAHVNFYKTKARNIRRSALDIIARFGGKVPSTMEELVTLPGVARKTANIVLSEAFGINEGIAVDTHVKRLAGRLGFTSHTDPVKIERDLMAVTPRKDWADLSNVLIFHGRRVCKARKPKHDECEIFDLCPSNSI